ncbi:MAG: type II toxin-antitoxin system VapC family toxin [Salinibacter sp.]|uniref:type II toxin-antitoxin system VapC family toxin n=1 Tax=Salinibacter sp. TaxID=2065818 RepID=UPI0035D4D2D5
MRRGFDTGYFVKYATGKLSETHRQVLRDLAREDGLGIANGLVIYELKKLGDRGVLDMEDAEWLVNVVGDACEVERVLSNSFLDEAARLSHGNDLSMADAMMLTTALRHDAEELYTTDHDLLAYDGPIEVVLV